MKGHLDRCPKDRCAKGPYTSISFRRLLGIADGMTKSVDGRRSDLLCDISDLRKVNVRRSLGDAPLLPRSRFAIRIVEDGLWLILMLLPTVDRGHSASSSRHGHTLVHGFPPGVPSNIAERTDTCPFLGGVSFSHGTCHMVHGI